MGKHKLTLKQANEGSELKNNKKKMMRNKPSQKEIEEKANINSLGRKKGDKEKKNKVGATTSDLSNMKFDDEENGQKGKLSRKRKTYKVGASKSVVEKADKLNYEVEGYSSDQIISQETAETKTSKMRKKRKKGEKRKNTTEDQADEIHKEDGIKEETKVKDSRKKKKKTRALSRKDEKVLEEKVEPEEDDVYEMSSRFKTYSKKMKGLPLLEETFEPEEFDVYEMSSGDEDCSRGMKKWITEYHQSRPGLKVLQDQIDDFITAHEEEEAKARKEREEQAAEGGWTVVVHHKGRKKTTEAESGTAVGSVASAVVLENMAKKKNNQVGIDFYRFQKREARMNEIMALQSKFEEDKKRIKQMRDARKFRPY